MCTLLYALVFAKKNLGQTRPGVSVSDSSSRLLPAPSDPESLSTGAKVG